MSVNHTIMAVRTLPSDLQKIAANEINEEPNRVPSDIQAIKEWMIKEPHLNGRTEDQWILRYLRGCKFSIQFTKDKIDNYYSLRSTVPQFFKNRDPMLPEIQHVLNQKITTALNTNISGPQTVILRLENWDEGTTLATVAKINLMVLEILLNENDYMLLGQYAIIDLQNLDLVRLSELSVTAIRNLAALHYAYPVRPKCIIFLNAPTLVMKLYNTFSYLLREKIRNRVRFYSKKNLKSIQEMIPISILPKEYGGEACWDKLGDYWKQKVESYRDWFIDDDKYGVDESKRLKKKYDLDYVDGNFRKLEVD